MCRPSWLQRATNGPWRIARTQARVQQWSRHNIASLREAWTFDIPNGAMFGAATSSALVLEGVVYVVDSQSNVFALNAKAYKDRCSP